MATDEYWIQKRAALADEYSTETRLSEVAHTGGLALCTVEDALRCRVAGLEEEANRLLEYLCPLLRKEATNQVWFEGRSQYEGTEMMMWVSDAAHVAWWLHTEQFDIALAEQAFDWRMRMEKLWGGRVVPHNLLSVMFLSIEKGDPEGAAAFYEKQTKNSLVIPPPNLRFARNARSVLYLNLRLARDRTHDSLRASAMKSFLAAATKWEKDIHPLPYIGLLDVARLIRATWQLQGKQPSITSIAKALK